MQTRANMAVVALIVVGAMPALFSSLELLSYFSDVNSYRFGTEVGSYFYTTAYHFMSYHGIVLGLFLVAVVARQWPFSLFAIAMQFAVMITSLIIL